MRNDIRHGKGLREEDNQLHDKIVWVVAHKEQLLAYQDRWVANIDLRLLEKMKRDTKWKWVKNFDRARGVYKLEQRQEARGQGLITYYFKPDNGGLEGGGATVVPMNRDLGQDPG